MDNMKGDMNTISRSVEKDMGSKFRNLNRCSGDRGGIDLKTPNSSIMGMGKDI